MEDYYTIVFEDQTDESGNRKEFTVLRYDFDFNQKIDHNSIPASQNDESVIEVEIHNTTNTSLLEWAMAHSSTTQIVKNGELLIYNYSDDSMLRSIQFKDAECIELKEGAIQDNQNKKLEKTLIFKFSSKKISIDEYPITETNA